MAKLARNVDNTSTLRKSFTDQVIDRVTAEWPSGGSAEMKWGAIKGGALTSSADSILGTPDRRHPDWFRESVDALKPALRHRNNMYTRWLATRRADDLSRFRRARSACRQAVRGAKNRWYDAKAKEAQKGVFGGKLV